MFNKQISKKQFIQSVLRQSPAYNELLEFSNGIKFIKN